MLDANNPGSVSAAKSYCTRSLVDMEESSDSETALEVTFSIIAGSAFVSNLMFCVVLLKKPSMMKKPYNNLLFNLAITDLLTGVILVLTPGYVKRQPLFPIPTGFGGHMFCALLANRYLLFTVAKASILLVTCLALERWYSVLKPVKYMAHFGRKRRILYVVVSWILSCVLQIHKFFEKKLVGNKCVCVDAPYGEKGSQVLIAIYSFANYIVPCIVTWLTFTHIKLRLLKVPEAAQKSERRRIQQKLVLRLCALTAVVFTLSWLPAQISYTLSPFEITDITSSLHKSWNVIAFLNSCVNPLIYWYYHKEYRNEFIKLFCGCKDPLRAINPTNGCGYFDVSNDLQVNQGAGESSPQQSGTVRACLHGRRVNPYPLLLFSRFR